MFRCVCVCMQKYLHTHSGPLIRGATCVHTCMCQCVCVIKGVRADTCTHTDSETSDQWRSLCVCMHTYVPLSAHFGKGARTCRGIKGYHAFPCIITSMHQNKWTKRKHALSKHALQESKDNRSKPAQHTRYGLRMAGTARGLAEEAEGAWHFRDCKYLLGCHAAHNNTVHCHETIIFMHQATECRSAARVKVDKFEDRVLVGLQKCTDTGHLIGE